MVVNNDFEVQLNETKRVKAGMSLPPYRYNVTAKPRCGRCCSEVNLELNPKPFGNPSLTHITAVASISVIVRAGSWYKQGDNWELWCCQQSSCGCCHSLDTNAYQVGSVGCCH
jgi:hypothetical protein